MNKIIRQIYYVYYDTNNNRITGHHLEFSQGDLPSKICTARTYHLESALKSDWIDLDDGGSPSTIQKESFSLP